MTDEQKAQIKADLHSGAARVAKTANEKAKAASGWKRWLWAAGAIIAAAVAWFTTACTASYSQSASGDIEYRGSIIPIEREMK
ncbi:MAG: hypothetical protein IKW19_05955 [Akkermansia sp.]|nr:hypothetical protein [Akkermansia sp.]MBR5185824.1 hypothetical protein [Akkermansia sp.]